VSVPDDVMTVTPPGPPAGPGGGPDGARSGSGRPSWLTAGFLAPALALLAVLVVYPIFYTVWRSLRDADGHFAGLRNYGAMFTSDATLTAIKNNAIWLLVAPTVVTALGLVFAVLTERVRWATAFKLVVFMPMAISSLAAGIIFTLVYTDDPDRGLANAALVGVHGVFSPSAGYSGARPRDPSLLADAPGGGLRTARTYQPGETAALALVGVRAADLPNGAADAVAATPAAGTLAGTVWFDFVRGGGGRPGVIDPGEKGLPKVVVQAVSGGTGSGGPGGGSVVATVRTDDRGAFAFTGLAPGSYSLQLPASNFAEPFTGFTWLGPTLVTWAIIGAYVWMWSGFAMVLIAAGLSAIPREALEAARVDGGTEWQVFRKVTVPLLAPVLVVVLITLMINVMKIFDLVITLAPQSSQDDANVLALEMWRVSFGGGHDQGLGSALGVFLFVLVLPAMIFNIRRFRREAR